MHRRKIGDPLPQERRISIHLYLNAEEYNQLWNLAIMERERGISGYVTKVLRRDLHDAAQDCGKLPPPAKTPREYEDEIKHLHKVIQGLNAKIERYTEKHKNG